MFSKLNNINRIPPVVLNTIIINSILLFATWFFESRSQLDLNEKLGLHFFMSDKFHFYQFFSYMFMHGGFSHLFFNMFAVYMFGQIFERIWGGKKFLFFYLFAGIGAAIVQQTIWYIDYSSIVGNLSHDSILQVKREGAEVLAQGLNYTDSYLGRLNLLFNVPTIGASGAVFGILLAFGMMFPYEKLMLIFFPVPIQARWFVILYGVLELFAGVANFAGDNIAHFAHLGGLIFGLMLILFWRKQNKLFDKRM